jgi:hypothetical protein
MARVRHDYESSDSDEERHHSGAETNVLLGIPDGKIESEGDLIDAAVSRIGGLPVRAYHVLSINILTFYHATKKGTASDKRAFIHIVFLQILFPTNGTACSVVVPLRRQPDGPSIICLGMRANGLPRKRRQVSIFFSAVPPL